MLLWNILWRQWNHVLNSQLINQQFIYCNRNSYKAILFALCPFFAPVYAFYRDYSIEHYVNAINLLYEIFIMNRSLFSEARKLHVWFPLIFSRSWIVNQSKRLIFQVLSLCRTICNLLALSSSLSYAHGTQALQTGRSVHSESKLLLDQNSTVSSSVYVLDVPTILDLRFTISVLFQKDFNMYYYLTKW